MVLLKSKQNFKLIIPRGLEVEQLIKNSFISSASVKNIQKKLKNTNHKCTKYGKRLLFVYVMGMCTVQLLMGRTIN